MMFGFSYIKILLSVLNLNTQPYLQQWNSLRVINQPLVFCVYFRLLLIIETDHLHLSSNAISKGLKTHTHTLWSHLKILPSSRTNPHLNLVSVLFLLSIKHQCFSSITTSNSFLWHSQGPGKIFRSVPQDSETKLSSSSNSLMAKKCYFRQSVR